MKIIPSRFILRTGLLFILFAVNQKVHAQLPVKEEVISGFRSQILLNGIWKFQPAEESASQQPTDDWGEIRVPGAWATKDAWWTEVPGVLKKGTGPVWKKDSNEISRAWYEQKLLIPVSWKGRKVELQIERVSTDAVVFVNDKKAGTVEWFSGAVDVTPFVNWGKENVIRILVIATPEEGEVANLMGTADAQVSFSKAHLATRGLTGNLILISYPPGHYISDVFVKPSVRKQTLEAEVEWKGTSSKNLLLQFDVKDDKGVTVKTFKSLSAEGLNSIISAAEWTNPKLWDLDQPNLYQLHVSLMENGKLIDTYVQTFGFREFWIEGKNFFLNGTRINLRPALDPPGQGMEESTIAGIQGLREQGFNFSELWPNNYDIRGHLQNWHSIMEAADKKGFLLSGVLLPFTFYMVDKSYSYRWDNAGVKSKWEKRMLQEMKRQRNHPSIIVWGTSPNFFGHTQDQNPLFIGQRNWIKDNDFWQRNAKAANEAIAIIKQHDPTRPVYTHHGAYVGDIHTVNFYLDLIPLQEREEWLSHYTQHGQMPFMAIEFGTPFYCTFLRGRNGYGNAIQSEPLVTEFAAMYQGSKAYATENAAYRHLIKHHFSGGQKYKSLTNPEVLEAMPSFTEIQRLFIQNTWRSWRTWGISGGMLPWDRAHGWIKSPSGSARKKMPAFEPGRRGNYFEQLPAHNLQYLAGEGWQTLPAGIALAKNNNSTLAYIGGSETAFTEKNHHFRPGEVLLKQLFFFNDTRLPQICQWTASIWIDGKQVRKENGTMHIPVGKKGVQKLVYRFSEKQPTRRSNGLIKLTANIGGEVLQDSFSFRVFSRSAAGKKTVFVFDPEGTTTSVLEAEGFTVKKWDGKTSVPFLLIGRNALLLQYKPHFNLEEFIRKGGKALVMAQHPDSIAVKRGFRKSQYVSRYVFPVDAKHDLFSGLDEIDFRNWNGVSHLTEAYPDYVNNPAKKGSYNIPYYGWHWGNRGGVSSSAIEKPHHSAWRPLMECEFDLAWTPLMELPYGKGHLIWNSLDLEDHASEDVIAQMMLHRLINYTDTLKTNPRQSVVLWGSHKDSLLLSSIGLVFQLTNQLPKQNEVLLVGNIDVQQENRLMEFVKKGGKAVVLPRSSAQNFAGIRFRHDTGFSGALQIPRWKELAGLSSSDTRNRVEGPAVLIQDGCEVGAGGLFGKKTVGSGSLLFIQIDPRSLPADSFTYYRYSRWRHTRALSQVLANAGASFQMDAAFFRPMAAVQPSVDLEGAWKVVMTTALPASKEAKDKYLDPGISSEAKKYIPADANEQGMETLESGISFERGVQAWGSKDGELVLRKTINVPQELIGQDLTLHLGIIDDYDHVYINGVLVGQTGVKDEPVWNKVRTYTVPAGLCKPGNNVIAIRLFDTFGEGGLMPGSIKRRLVLKNPPKMLSLYHDDYRDDFALGDDPFRYYRW